MIKKEDVKKIILPSIIVMAIFTIIFLAYTKIQYNQYRKTINSAIDNVITEVMKKYPNTSEEEIIKNIQNDTTNNNKSILQKYGYFENEIYLKSFQNDLKKATIIYVSIIIAFGLVLIIGYLIYNSIRNKKIEDIRKYLEKINKKDYELKIEDNTDDQLSILRNELYKTTVLLKETAENSKNESKQLSNSLADISHQLKTPLTSIRIMIDNIYENPNMDEATRTDFLSTISKQLDWISSLVISLLKLAKFDAGTIKMNDKEIIVKDLISEVISNLSILLELKNISIKSNVPENAKIVADYKWQLEAITNIIKNSIEHSNTNSEINIDVEDSSVFLKITITDKGEGIKKEDAKHIFERFYKANNSSENSIGIGLSLAKTIIEKENGYITVDSEIGRGTKFIIKFLK